MEKKIQIMLVDDHSLVRDGIRSLLEDEDQFEVTLEASNGEEAVLILEKDQADVMIIDIRMPIMNGIELVSLLSKKKKATKFLMLSMHDSEEYVLQSIQAGAHGYLLKDASREEFLKAIHSVYADELYFSGDISKYLVQRFKQNAPETPKKQIRTDQKVQNNNPANLTKRELQILELAISGLSNQDIADSLGKSKRTVEVHRFNLMKKIESKNLADLIVKAREMGYT